MATENIVYVLCTAVQCTPIAFGGTSNLLKGNKEKFCDGAPYNNYKSLSSFNPIVC